MMCSGSTMDKWQGMERHMTSGSKSTEDKWTRAQWTDIGNKAKKGKERKGKARQGKTVGCCWWLAGCSRSTSRSVSRSSICSYVHMFVCSLVRLATCQWASGKVMWWLEVDEERTRWIESGMRRKWDQEQSSEKEGRLERCSCIWAARLCCGNRKMCSLFYYIAVVFVSCPCSLLCVCACRCWFAHLLLFCSWLDQEQTAFFCQHFLFTTKDIVFVYYMTTIAVAIWQQELVLRPLALRHAVWSN